MSTFVVAILLMTSGISVAFNPMISSIGQQVSAAPTLTPSATSGLAPARTASYFIVTGSGFPAGRDLAFYWVGLYPASGGIAAAFPAGDYWGHSTGANPIAAGNFLIAALADDRMTYASRLPAFGGDLRTDANGWFKATVQIPSLPARTWKFDVMVAADSASAPPAPSASWAGTCGVDFTIQARVQVATGGSVTLRSSGYVGDTLTFRFAGFGTYDPLAPGVGVTGENVRFRFQSGAVSETVVAAFATGAGAPRQVTGATLLAPMYGLAYTVVADGATSLIVTSGSGSGSFTVNPKVYFFDVSGKVAYVFSFRGPSMGTAIYVGAEGLPSGTITAATVGGVTLTGGFPINVASVVGTRGQIGGGGTIAAGVAAGMVTAGVVGTLGVAPFVLTTGTAATLTFDVPDRAGIAVPTTNAQDKGGIINSQPIGTPPYGGIITVLTGAVTDVLGNIGPAGAGTVGSINYVIIGSGFGAAELTQRAFFVGTRAGEFAAVALAAVLAATDANGAFIMLTTVGLPARTGFPVGGNFFIDVYDDTLALRLQADAPSPVARPIVPLISVSPLRIRWQQAAVYNIEGTGFAAGELVSVTIGGVTLTPLAAVNTIGTLVAGEGSFTALNPFVVAAATTPDIAGGTQNIVASTPTSSSTASTTCTVMPFIQAIAASPAPVGTPFTVIGHGLTPGTGQIKWGGAETGTAIGSTFTINSVGFFQNEVNVPASAGDHGPAPTWGEDQLVDVVLQSAPTASLYYGLNRVDYFYTVLGAFVRFDVDPSLATSPTVAHVGDTLSILGNGLAKENSYQLWYAAAFTGTPFTSSATGTTPGVTYTVPSPPAAQTWPLTANARNLEIRTTGGVALLPVTVYPLVTYPKYSLDITTGMPGATVTLTGTGMPSVAGGGWLGGTVQVVFGGNLAVNPAVPGTVVASIPVPASGVIVPTGFTVPSVTTGSYRVQIWVDADNDGVQDFGELGTLTTDVISFNVGGAPAGGVGDVANKLLVGGTTVKYLYGATASVGGTKLPGVTYAAPADVYAAAGALQGAGGSGYAQAWDTSPAAIDLTTGRPQLAWAPSGSYIVMTGGPAVHNAIKYYMDLATGADQSPAFFRAQTIAGITYYQFVMRASSAVIVSVPVADVAGMQRDVCLIQSFTDSAGRIVFIITGLNAPGTQAGALWFAKTVMANPSAYANTVYVIGWNDTTTPWTAAGVTVTGNNDTFVDYLTEIQKIYP